MKKLVMVAALAGMVSLLGPAAVSADVYVKKTGEVIEGKTIKVNMKPIKGKGSTPKPHYVVKTEEGKEIEISEADIAYVVKAKPSWEVRAENKAWYEKEAPKIKDDWKSREAFGKAIRKKKYLEAEAEIQFKKAYELRKPEIKDEVESHAMMAKVLESDWELYETAKEEWRWVYNKKRETCDAPAKLVTLAKWCIDEGLYDEAAEAYNEALKANPAYKDAQKGLKRLENSPKVNGQFYRALYGKLNIMVARLESQRKGDGSFGSDVDEAAVHGKLGMTSLVGLALLAKWDFNVMKNASAMDTCPGSVKAIMPFICLVNEKGKIPEDQSKDVWGPIWRLMFLGQAYKHDAVGPALKKRIEKRTKETFAELATLQRPDGGWAYYEFVKNGITFVTACCIVAMMDCKEAGLEIDEKMLEKACESVKTASSRKGMYGYHYQGGGESDIGCAGRSSLCEYSLIRAGKGDVEALQVAVDNFFKHRHLLEAIKDQPGTHIGQGQTAPYYYLFGHYWTTRAIHLLPKEKWSEYYKKLRDIIIRNMRPNGDLTDTPLTRDAEVYGTAFGALWAYQMALDEWRMKSDEEDKSPGDAEEKAEGEEPKADKPEEKPAPK